MPPPPLKTVIQKDGILYIVDQPMYTSQRKPTDMHKQEQHKQHNRNSIITQCYQNHKKLGVTYPDSVQSQFRFLNDAN